MTLILTLAFTKSLQPDEGSLGLPVAVNFDHVVEFKSASICDPSSGNADDFEREGTSIVLNALNTAGRQLAFVVNESFDEIVSHLQVEGYPIADTRPAAKPAAPEVTH